MSIAESMEQSLQALKQKENTPIDRSHCAAFMSTFGATIKKVLASSIEPVYRIPFPKGCGKDVQQYLVNERIPKSDVMLCHIDRTEYLLVLFDTTTNTYKTTMSY